MGAISGMRNLKALATALDAGILSPEQLAFVAKALRDISEGVDPKLALGINAKRGEKTGKKAQNVKFRQAAAMSYVAAARAAPETENPEDCGLGLTREKACARADEAFGLKEGASLDCWKDNKHLRKRDF